MMQPTSLLLRRLPRLSPRLPTPRAPSSIPSPPSIAIPRRHISTKHHPPARPIPAPSPPSHGLLALIGATGGGLGALAGIGGAVFIVPGLVRFCGLTQPAAAGSAMTAVVAVSATSAALHAAEERRGGGDQSGAEEEEEEEAPRSGVCWPVAALVAGAAAVTTPFGARLAPTVNPKWLRRGLGMFLLVLAPMMPLRALLMEEGEGGVGQGVSKDEVVKAGEVTDIAKAELLAGGAGIGFAAGMLGIGGGSLMTPYIAVFQPNLPITVILGTSFAAMLPPSIVAAISYNRLGLIRWPLVAPLAAGAAFGAAVGSRVVLNLPEDVLRWGFATIFFAMGLRILRAPIKPKPPVQAGGRS